MTSCAVTTGSSVGLFKNRSILLCDFSNMMENILRLLIESLLCLEEAIVYKTETDSADEDVKF